MNLFQRINITASLAVLGAAGVAYYTAIASAPSDQSLSRLAQEQTIPLLLTGFVLLFKVKTMLDDHQHFGEERQKQGGWRHVGFLFAIVSWFFWILAAYFLFTPSRSAELMIASVAISTAWIAVHIIELLVEGKRGKELAVALMREKWVLFNVGYILCLATFNGLLAPVVQASTAGPLIVLLILLLTDYVSSGSYPENRID